MKNLKENQKNWYEKLADAFKKEEHDLPSSASPVVALPVLEEWASPEEYAA